MSINDQNNISTHENVFAGIVGAFLFSLVGGLVWFLLYLVGFFAGISGMIGVILAIKGYALFAKKESIKGIIIASVIAFLVLVLAWYLCFGKDVYEAFQMWYSNGEIDYTLTYAESLRAVPAFLTDPEIGPEYIKDLVIGLILALIGSVGTIITSIRNIKAQNQVQPQAQYPAQSQTQYPEQYPAQPQTQYQAQYPNQTQYPEQYQNANNDSSVASEYGKEGENHEPDQTV